VPDPSRAVRRACSKRPEVRRFAERKHRRRRPARKRTRRAAATPPQARPPPAVDQEASSPVRGPSCLSIRAAAAQRVGSQEPAGCSLLQRGADSGQHKANLQGTPEHGSDGDLQPNWRQFQLAQAKTVGRRDGDPTGEPSPPSALLNQEPSETRPDKRSHGPSTGLESSTSVHWRKARTANSTSPAWDGSCATSESLLTARWPHVMAGR